MPSTGVLVILAIIPAVIIIAFIYHKDKAEKEPLGLLVSLFIMGATISVIGAIVAQSVMLKGLQEVIAEGTTGYNFIMCFFIVALSEEGFKFLVLRLRTWKHKAFNYTFDGIVYAVIVSLGFATLENILYLVKDGTYNLAIMRGVLSVPGHAIDAVFMGLFYGKAKYCQCAGDNSGKSKNMFLSLFVPILMHGFYDFCLFNSKNMEGIIVLFFVYEAVVTVSALVIIHKSSKNDTNIPGTGMGIPFYQFPAYPYNYYQNSYQNTYANGYNYQYGAQYQSTAQNYYTPNGYTQPNTQYQNTAQGYGYGQDQAYGQMQYQGGYQNNYQYQNQGQYQYQGSYQQNGYAQQGQYNDPYANRQQYQNNNYNYPGGQ